MGLPGHRFIASPASLVDMSWGQLWLVAVHTVAHGGTEIANGMTRCTPGQLKSESGRLLLVARMNMSAVEGGELEEKEREGEKGRRR